jgi:hypothetical protein
MIHYSLNPFLGNFNRNLFDKIVGNIKFPFDAIYLSPSNWHSIYKINFTEKIVIIGLDDNLDFDPEYNYWNGTQVPKKFKFFSELAKNNPNKTIVLILEGNFWSAKHFEPLSNIRVINWHPLQENDTYPTIVPVNKNFDSTKIGIALNRQMRQHRMALLSFLYGLNLDQYCHITAVHLYKQLNKFDSDDFLTHNDWHFDRVHDQAKHHMQIGFQKVVKLFRDQKTFQKPAEDIYPVFDGTDTVVEFNNKNNFEKNLRPLYTNSFVEFISCRLYSEPTISIDEKYVNNIYGRNLPIIIGSQGTVEFYRSSGLDLFDDIVDHSYDLIANPIDRLVCAISANQHLLTNYADTKNVWKTCEERFNKNIAFTQKNLYNWSEGLTLKDCNLQISDLIKEKFNERS